MDYCPKPSDIRPITDDRTVDIEYSFEEIEQLGTKYYGTLDYNTGILEIKS